MKDRCSGSYLSSWISESAAVQELGVDAESTGQRVNTGDKKIIIFNKEGISLNFSMCVCVCV